MVNDKHIPNIQHFKTPLNYDINSPSEPNSWDGKAYPISIFGHIEFLEINSKNMFTSLL